MKGKNVKLLGFGLAGMLALTSVVALADGQPQGRFFGKGMMFTSNSENGPQALTTEERLAKLKEMLDKQVADGRITQEKADEIYSKAQEGDFSGMRMGKGQNMKELTDEEKAQMEADRLARLKERLDEQVADGTITQEKADEIYANAEAGNFERPECDILTDEDKADMKAKMLADLKEKLDAKVAAGTITQEQADEFYARAEEGKFPMGGGRMGRGHGHMQGKPDGGADSTEEATDSAEATAL